VYENNLQTLAVKGRKNGRTYQIALVLIKRQ